MRIFIRTVSSVRCLFSWWRQSLLCLLLLIPRDSVTGTSLTVSPPPVFPFTFSASASFGVLSGPRPLAASGDNLCLLSDGTLLMASLSSPFYAVGLLASLPTRHHTTSQACVLSTRDAARKLRSLQIVPAFMIASMHEQKLLTVLAHFSDVLICDVTNRVVWQAEALSVWHFPASPAFFLLQAKLANHFSNRAFIQGTPAR